MKKLTSLLVAAVVAVGAAELCLYTVGEREYALVFALGELKDVKSEPGLYVKLPAPLQNIVYLDKRILTLDAPNSDLVQTSEKKNLLIDSFVRWRIADPRKYWVSFIGNERAAEDRVAALLRDVLNQTVNRRTVNEITSREREKAMNEIQKGLQARVQDIGIDIVDVRLKRVDFTPEISESVYRRMEAERKRVASEERSKGAAAAERIRAQADREREVILAEAYRQAQEIKGEGDAQANAVYAEAFNRNPEFAKFYRNIEAYKQSFGKSTDMIVLDGSGEFFTFNRIVLPMLKPAVSVQLIFTFVESWNNYFLPALLLDKAEMKTVPIMIAQLRAADYSKFDLGKVYMFILLAILPVLLVYIFLSRYIVKGVTAGSVKG